MKRQNAAERQKNQQLNRKISQMNYELIDVQSQIQKGDKSSFRSYEKQIKYIQDNEKDWR